MKKILNFLSESGEIFKALLLAVRAVIDFSSKNWKWVGWLYALLGVIIAYELYEYARWISYPM
ncbi:MAG: hypothetical protein WCT49_00630 [Candidatus Paceibacterota bacterium]|nr:hypothetical protein [Candidatus Paceibacterota bacterium]